MNGFGTLSCPSDVGPGAATYGLDPGLLLAHLGSDCNGDGIVDYGQCRDGSLPDHNGNNVPDQCEAGRALMWGQNDFGQLDAPPIPLRQINSHADFTVGIDLDGNLRGWGNPPYPEPYLPFPTRCLGSRDVPFVPVVSPYFRTVPYSRRGRAALWVKGRSSVA